MSVHPDRTETTTTTDEESPDEGLPAPEYDSPKQTRIPDQTETTAIRERAIRVRLPREPAIRDELPEDIHGVLVWVLSDVCAESNIESVEILMYPGRRGLEFVLTPRVKWLDDRSHTQSKLDGFPKELTAPGIAKLKQAVKRRYPGTITAEIGTLRLDPIGVSDVTTSRLYLNSNSQPLHAGVIKEKPLEDLFDALREGHDPFIYQVIAERSDGRYNLVVRLATYHSRDIYSGERGFARLVEHGKPNDPARAFSTDNICSNHDAEIATKYWDISYAKTIDGSDWEVHYDFSTVTQYTTRQAVKRKAQKVKQIVLGKQEHRRLLLADTTGDPICPEEFGRHYRISMHESQLWAFVWTYTKRWETNPWRVVPGREAPQFYSIEEIEIESPGEYGIGAGFQDAPSGEPTVQNEGSAHHSALEQFTERVFTEGGDTIEQVQQNTTSVPDLRLTTDDGEIQTLGLQVGSEIVPVECESQNVTRASNTLINAERAYAADRHVIFVYEQADVERGYSHLKAPYKRTCEGGVTLYTQTEPVRTTDGRVLVGRDLPSTTWHLKGSTLIATDGEEPLARGPATDDVATFDWDCHYYREVDDGHRVETADGDLVETYGSKEAFKADWTRIAKPHVPVAPCYLEFVTVTYRDAETGQLTVYDPRPDWESSDRTASQKAGYKRFHETQIVEREGGELTYDDLEAVFTSWFEGHSQYEAPVRSIIGGWHPEAFKDAKTGGTSNRYKYFDGYDLRLAPIDDSPHQPGPPADLDTDTASSGDGTEGSGSQ